MREKVDVLEVRDEHSFEKCAVGIEVYTSSDSQQRNFLPKSKLLLHFSPAMTSPTMSPQSSGIAGGNLEAEAKNLEAVGAERNRL